MSNILISIAKHTLRKTGLLSRFYHAVNRVYPTFNSLHPANLIALLKAFRQRPTGDYYEFGVYKGFSLWFATQLAGEFDLPEMRFFGFDSFEGLPVPRGVDREPDVQGNTFAKGAFCAGRKIVENRLRALGSDMDRMSLTEGYFEDVLVPPLIEKLGMGTAAIILIDCDMYNSTMTVLGFVPELLRIGTIILFDDWGLTGADKGQQLACREWLARNSSIRLEPFCDFDGGKGFIVASC